MEKNKMFNYNQTFAEENTIACSNNGDNGHRACGKNGGEYHSNGYNAVVTPLYRFDDVELRSVENNGAIRYEVLFDNEVYQRFPSLKNATVYFLDFSGLTKGKLKKCEVKAA